MMDPDFTRTYQIASSLSTTAEPLTFAGTSGMPVELSTPVGNGDGDPDLPSGTGNYRCGGE